MVNRELGHKETHAGIVLGMGFAGLFDGFMLHMIFQWHHMLSNVIPQDTREDMHRLMRADGIFDAFSFSITLIGVFLLWNAARRGFAIPRMAAFVGQIVLGFGVFNLLEGIIDHHILKIHYVRQVADYAIYNWSFLALAGVLPILIGWLLIKSRREISGAART